MLIFDDFWSFLMIFGNFWWFSSWKLFLIILNTRTTLLSLYLFFEVFFSFIRKIAVEKKSPLFPDNKHLHMLLYKILFKKNNDKSKSNYSVSIIINLTYLILIIPAVFMMSSGLFCKYYSLILFAVYIFTYKIISKKNNI